MFNEYCLCGFESLEQRALLTIVWANEHAPENGFDRFGADEAVAREIVHRAIDEWSRVILDFDYDRDNDPLTNNTFEIEVFVDELERPMRGQAFVRVLAGTLPQRGEMFLDFAGGGWGWYLDPTPRDDAEFVWDAQDSLRANLAGSTREDLYRTVLHEMGHALGFVLTVESGFNQRLYQFLTPAGRDQYDRSCDLFLFHNPAGPFGVHATLTTCGGGHLYEGPADPQFPTVPRHASDLMHSGRAADPSIQGTTRQRISQLDVQILADAYGYQVSLPTQSAGSEPSWSPLTGTPQAGDANQDGQFDRFDIVQVLRAGKYRTGLSATWSEGDWNGDRLFDQLDLIVALQTGNYEQGTYAEFSTVTSIPRSP